MIKLPDSLEELASDNQLLKDEYNTNMQNWITNILKTSTNTVVLEYYNDNSNKYYVNFEKSAREYFLSDEINKYKSTSNEDELIEKQNEIEIETNKLKIEVKEIRNLESQIKQIENKKTLVKTQNNQIENDLQNISANNDIDIKISEYKNEKQNLDNKLESIMKTISEIQKKQKTIIQYENLLLKRSTLEMELQQLIDVKLKFETYKFQIEQNNIVQSKICILKEELREFEEVMEEIDRQYNQETGNVMKYESLLQQMRQDIDEARKMEQKLKLYEIYKNALKQLPYILLNNKVQPILEKKVNNLLSIMTDFMVKFDMSENKIDIYIDRPVYKGKYILINNGSGFERFIASLAIRLALLELSNLPKINFMAIDEGWSSFDTHNINNVGSILDYLKTKFDFILTISHLTQIKEYCDIQINLKQDNNKFTRIY
jgi:DNA repair exonuclease SbcCD ATPase subunit